MDSQSEIENNSLHGPQGKETVNASIVNCILNFTIKGIIKGIMVKKEPEVIKINEEEGVDGCLSLRFSPET